MEVDPGLCCKDCAKRCNFIGYTQLEFSQRPHPQTVSTSSGWSPVFNGCIINHNTTDIHRPIADSLA